MTAVVSARWSPKLGFVLRVGVFVMCCITLAKADAAAPGALVAMVAQIPLVDVVSNGLFKDNTANHIANLPAPTSDVVFPDPLKDTPANLSAKSPVPLPIIVSKDPLKDTPANLSAKSPVPLPIIVSKDPSKHSTTNLSTKPLTPVSNVVSNGLFKDNVANRVTNSAAPVSESEGKNVAVQVVVDLTEDVKDDVTEDNIKVVDYQNYVDVFDEDDLPLPETTPLVALAPASKVPDILAIAPYTVLNQTNFLVSKVSSMIGNLLKNNSTPDSPSPTMPKKNHVGPTPPAARLHHEANLNANLPALLSRAPPFPMDKKPSFQHKSHGVGASAARNAANAGMTKNDKAKPTVGDTRAMKDKSYRVLPNVRRVLPGSVAMS
jgi:hypothetical protein